METIKWVQGIVAFVKVAETLSFSRAADSLGVSKSHISKSIQKLEIELKTALFSRSTRKIQLTTRGEEFLKDCRTSLENLEAAKKGVIDSSQLPRGTLRVTLAGLFGEKFIVPVVFDLLKKYPELKIELDFNSRIVNVIDEKFDVAIRFGHLQDSSLIAHKIASRREFVCCSKKYLALHGSITSPKDLLRHNCLGGARWSFKKGSSSTVMEVSGSLKSNNPRVLMEAALNGIGVVRLPGSYVFNEIKKGKLVSILEDYSLGEMDIWAVTSTRNEHNINVKVFIHAIKAALSKSYPGVMF